MYTLNQFVEYLNSLAGAHEQIMSFGEGDPWEIGVNDKIYHKPSSGTWVSDGIAAPQYPLMWVVPQPFSTKMGNGTTEALTKYTLLFLDIENEDKSNELEVLSDQREIAFDILAQLKNPGNDDNFIWDSPANFTPVTEKFADLVAGWKVDITIRESFLEDRCAVPSTFNEGAPNSYPAPPAFAHNSDNSFTVYFESGSANLLRDIIITDHFGNAYTVPSCKDFILPDIMIFTTLSGLVWDGSFKEITLTQNISIVTNGNPYMGGALRVVQGGAGSYTLSINGTNIAGLLTAIGSATLVSMYKDGSNGLDYIIDTSSKALDSPAIPETPIIISISATDAHTVTVLFNVLVIGTIAGWSFSNGSPLTITGVTGVGSNTLSFTISETMLSSDNITFIYNAILGDIAQYANPLEIMASASGAVSNDIVSFVFLTFALSGHQSGTITESPTNTYTLVAPAFMYSDQAMLADGQAFSELYASSTNPAVGLDHVAVNNTFYASGNQWDYLLLPYSVTGTYIIMNIGDTVGGLTNTGVSWAIGDLFGFQRTGNTVIALYSRDNGAIWITLHTFTATTSATLYAKFDADGGTGIKNPTGLGMS